MERKIRVGIINYLNTRPLLFGLKRPPISNIIELVEDYPANLAEKLIAGTIDVGLVPVAITKKLPQYYINGKFCIGAVGNVASVCLFSDKPLQEIKKIYLDYQSRSSVQLLTWLVKNYWKIEVELVSASDETYINAIKNDIAGLVIGDRALVHRNKTKYIYDLAGEWKAATGLPFVFAAWISTKPLPQDFIQLFDEANEYGLQHLDDVIAQCPKNIYNLNTYYAQNLSYRLDEAKLKGLELFLSSF
ncbi:MAG: menaquinone biosynthetic enzyme MqnA/MqnD family protein [Niabella sp.]